MAKLKKEKVKESIISALFGVFIFSIIILFTLYFLLEQKPFVGLVLLVFGIILIAILKIFGRKIKPLIPDLIFGFIDGTLMTILALIGASFAGVLGAVVGGAVGNVITDGVGGAFEGKLAENLRKKGIRQERTAISVALAKMSGVLLGVGIVLAIAWGIMSWF